MIVSCSANSAPGPRSSMPRAASRACSSCAKRTTSNLHSAPRSRSRCTRASRTQGKCIRASRAQGKCTRASRTHRTSRAATHRCQTRSRPRPCRPGPREARTAPASAWRAAQRPWSSPAHARPRARARARVDIGGAHLRLAAPRRARHLHEATAGHAVAPTDALSRHAPACFRATHAPPREPGARLTVAASSAGTPVSNGAARDRRKRSAMVSSARIVVGTSARENLDNIAAVK